MSIENAPGPEDRPEEKEKKAQAARLVDLADLEGFEFFHDAEGAAYARAPHGATWAISSSIFRRYLAGGFYRDSGTVPRDAAVKDAMAVLEFRAIYDGPEFPVFVRVGRMDDTLYLDLGDPSWRVVEIAAKGWRIVEGPDVPVHFRRPAGMLALPGGASRSCATT